jgi:hypothetical protein
MQLSVAERAVLLNMLPPAEGSALFLRAVRNLRLALSFTDKEIADWKIHNLPGGILSWDTTAAATTEVDISGLAKDYVAACLKKADEAGILQETILRVFDCCFPERG